MSQNLIVEKSFQFAIRIVKLARYLREEKKEYVLSKQILRSGTSVGANIREAENTPSKRDFTCKMNIALKEAGETEYWIELLIATSYLDKNDGRSILADCKEVNKILSSIVKTSRISLS